MGGLEPSRGTGIDAALRARRRREALAPYLLALPAAALVGLFVYGVADGVAQGFGVIPSLGLTQPTLAYYQAALTRPDLASSIALSARLSLLAAVLALVLGIVLSAALTRLRAGSWLRLTALQIPIMTMHALVAMAVMFVFSGSGLAARMLHLIGLVATPADFPSAVGDPSGWGIVAVFAWKEIPYVAFCTVTVMAHVSDTLGEAAATCGAGRVRRFLEVTLPLSAPSALRAAVVVAAFAFGSYEVPFLLGATYPKALPVLAYIEFCDPDLANRAYAMALNGVSTLICSLAALAYFAILTRSGSREVRSRG